MDCFFISGLNTIGFPTIFNRDLKTLHPFGLLSEYLLFDAVENRLSN